MQNSILVTLINAVLNRTDKEHVIIAIDGPSATQRPYLQGYLPRQRTTTARDQDCPALLHRNTYSSCNNYPNTQNTIITMKMN